MPITKRNAITANIANINEILKAIERVCSDQETMNNQRMAIIAKQQEQIASLNYQMKDYDHMRASREQIQNELVKTKEENDRLKAQVSELKSRKKRRKTAAPYALFHDWEEPTDYEFSELVQRNEDEEKEQEIRYFNTFVEKIASFAKENIREDKADIVRDIIHRTFDGEYMGMAKTINTILGKPVPPTFYANNSQVINHVGGNVTYGKYDN